MRYTNIHGFGQHLSASAPHQLCRVYLVQSPDPFECKQLLEIIPTFLGKKSPFITRFSDGARADEIIQALDSPALFSPEPIVIVEDVDKKLLEALEERLQEPRTLGYLLLGSTGKLTARNVEIHGVILDLMSEKPWEKEKRWIRQLSERACAAQKQLAPDAAMRMLEMLERDAAVLDSEMSKLLCYCAAKTTIDRRDVETICSSSHNHTFWQIAEDLVWEQTLKIEPYEAKDPVFIHGLIAAVRQQLMIGMKMEELRASQIPYAEWSTHFPKMWPKTMEKKAQAAARFGIDYFRHSQRKLFDIEMLAKSSSVPSDALADLIHLQLLRK